jgi:hypothetical protein
MSLCVYQIVLNDVNPETGRRNFVNLETEAQSVRELHNRLTNEGAIYGEQLLTQATEDAGTREIVDRWPRSLGLGAVYTIMLPAVQFVEYEEDPADN